MAPTATAPTRGPENPPPPTRPMVPVVQVKNFISAGSRQHRQRSITKPISAVRGLRPDPIMVNAVAYTAAAAGL